MTAIDATGIGGSVVTCASGEGPATVLKSLTVTGGTGTYRPEFFDFVGGGVFNVNSSPTIENCVIIGNTAIFGGGIYNTHGDASLTNCAFSGNWANGGGAIYNDYSNPRVTNCRFKTNGSYADGGGMLNRISSPTVSRCAFSGNLAGWYGGGMYNNDGDPTLENCTFTGNSAYAGGAMYNYSSNSVRDQLYIHWEQGGRLRRRARQLYTQRANPDELYIHQECCCFRRWNPQLERRRSGQ